MARKRLSGRARRMRKIKNAYLCLIANKTASIANDLPKDLLGIVGEYLPDIIVDGVPMLEHQVSLENLERAKTVHFFKSYRLRNGTKLPNCKKVSGVPTIIATSLMELFQDSEIQNSPDLSDWDVSNIQNMCAMFRRAVSFNSDLSRWDVSNVRDMSAMFLCTEIFNSNLSRWDVSNVRDMSFMFGEAKSFNSDLSRWDVSNVRYMGHMFSNAKLFNSDLSRWDVSNVKHMRYIFKGTDSLDFDMSSWYYQH
jgi:surface protein